MLQFNNKFVYKYLTDNWKMEHNHEFFNNYNYYDNPDYNYEEESHNRPVIPNIHLGIFVAIRDRNLEELMNWINDGHYVNFAGYEDVTPIMYAAELGYNEGVLALINIADITIIDAYGRSVFHIASQFCEKQTLQYLKIKMDNLGINILHIAVSDEELIPLEYAILGVNGENVSYLLDIGSLTNDNKQHVFEFAVECHNNAIVEGIQDKINTQRAILAIVQSFMLILNEN